jgi:DNA-directed RNA polymerase specialized sigma24 family protein
MATDRAETTRRCDIAEVVVDLPERAERPVFDRPSVNEPDPVSMTRTKSPVPPAAPAPPCPSDAREPRASQRSWANTPMASCLPSAEVYERVRQATSHDDQQAILYEHYYGACLAYARKYARSGLPAHLTPDDLVQDLFLKIAARQCLHRYQVRRAWMLCCLKNLWIDLRRKYRERPIPCDPELEAEAVDAFDLALLGKQLHTHLVALRRELHAEHDVDPSKEAAFDDWMYGLLGHPAGDEGCKPQRGAPEPGGMRVKRHRWIRKWSDELAARLRRDSGVEQLRDWQSTLQRRADTEPDDRRPPAGRTTEDRAREGPQP